jgi:pilus assembly protein Flp/PilA
MTRKKNDEGASAVEYGLMVAAIAAAIVGVVFVLGGIVQQAFQHTSNCIEQGTPGYTAPATSDFTLEVCSNTPAAPANG